MKRLSKEKRSQLALVTVMIVLVGTGLYMGLIRNQQKKIQVLTIEREKANKKINQISETSRNANNIETEVTMANKALALREEDMVSDDRYASMINLIRKFKLGHNVEIKQFDSQGEASLNVFPKFPYKQFTVSIMGSAYYHDLGRFICDFENKFKTSRILNVELLPETSQNPADKEKLMFRMDVVALIKSNEPSAEKKP